MPQRPGAAGKIRAFVPRAGAPLDRRGILWFMPEPAGEAARVLCADRSLDWYVRAQGAEVVVAAQERHGAEALDRTLEWLAGIAADEQEDWTMRLVLGNVLLDFPRARHRAARRSGGETVRDACAICRRERDRGVRGARRQARVDAFRGSLKIL